MTSRALVLGALTLLSLLFSGVAAATGAGACVSGNGANVELPNAPGPYVGLTMSAQSPLTAHENANSFKSQCCAQAGRGPNCF